MCAGDSYCRCLDHVNDLETVTSEQSSTPTFVSNSNASADSNSPKSKYNTSDKMALGVGLRLGITTLLVTIWMCCVHTSSLGRWTKSGNKRIYLKPVYFLPSLWYSRFYLWYNLLVVPCVSNFPSPIPESRPRFSFRFETSVDDELSIAKSFDIPDIAVYSFPFPLTSPSMRGTWLGRKIIGKQRHISPPTLLFCPCYCPRGIGWTRLLAFSF